MEHRQKETSPRPQNPQTSHDTVSIDKALVRPSVRHPLRRLPMTAQAPPVLLIALIYLVAPHLISSHAAETEKTITRETPAAISDDAAQCVKVIDLCLDHLPSQQKVTLGKIASNQSVEVLFRLKNQQANAIHIHSLRTDCGCLQTVIDEKTAMEQQTAQWSALLAPSTRAGKMARKLWVDFAPTQGRSLELTLEAEITAPITLHNSIVHASGDAEIIYVTGQLENDITITGCNALRETLSVLDMKNHGDSFRLETRPLIQFGRTTDLLRFQYERSGKLEQVDLPIEIQNTQKARFIPSSLPITWKDGHCTVRTRMLLLPGTELNPNEINLTFDEKHSSNRDFIIAEKRWRRTSEVLIEYEFQVIHTQSQSRSSSHSKHVAAFHSDQAPSKAEPSQSLRVVATDKDQRNLATLWLMVSENFPENPAN